MEGSWLFRKGDGPEETVAIPHTWNAVDGQDGGNDYWRGVGSYRKSFQAPGFDPDSERVILWFDGVSESAKVFLNGEETAAHDGGYSGFGVDITDALKEGENTLEVWADNSVNDRVYPQKADFTFYGGIYRPVFLKIMPRWRFDGGKYGGSGIRISPKISGKNAEVSVTSWIQGGGEISAYISDPEGKKVSRTVRVKVDEKGGSDPGSSGKLEVELPPMTIKNVHLWEGVKSPFRYTLNATLERAGKVVDSISVKFGVREIRIDSREGFFLNGKKYPLNGVSRHQDRKGIGSAISPAMHREDFELIRELGANSIRLAHYQHDQLFYDLCDEYGIVVWAEIPYISEHMVNGRENTISQMKELIIQNYNHPSICVWGISNEITISTKDRKDMLDNHHLLNELCHQMDPSRPTTLACYAMCGPFNPSAHITDAVAWNLYLGWYVPGFFLNDLWISFFHLVFPKRPLGFSEYGAEGMPNLHSNKPKRGDQTEEYQALYHEFMLKCFSRHPWMWCSYVWNMFDFAADARDQGGEPGMNHKGLVTFDRKIKKDSFYLYKAYWSQDPFVHICSKRFENRTEEMLEVKIYSNQKRVTLYSGEKKIGEMSGDRIFRFQVPLGEGVSLRAEAGGQTDTAIFRHVSSPDPSYILKQKGQSANWT